MAQWEPKVGDLVWYVPSNNFDLTPPRKVAVVRVYKNGNFRLEGVNAEWHRPSTNATSTGIKGSTNWRTQRSAMPDTPESAAWLSEQTAKGDRLRRWHIAHNYVYNYRNFNPTQAEVEALEALVALLKASK